MFVSLKETQCFFDHDKVSPWCWTKKQHKTWIKQTNLHKTDLLPTGRPLCRVPLRMRFRFYSFAPIFQCRQKQKRLILLLFQTTNFSGLYELQLPLLSKFGLFFVLHHLSFHSQIADRVWKDVIKTAYAAMLQRRHYFEDMSDTNNEASWLTERWNV